MDDPGPISAVGWRVVGEVHDPQGA